MSAFVVCEQAVRKPGHERDNGVAQSEFEQNAVVCFACKKGVKDAKVR